MEVRVRWIWGEYIWKTNWVLLANYEDTCKSGQSSFHTSIVGSNVENVSLLPLPGILRIETTVSSKWPFLPSSKLFSSRWPWPLDEHDAVSAAGWSQVHSMTSKTYYWLWLHVGSNRIICERVSTSLNLYSHWKPIVGRVSCSLVFLKIALWYKKKLQCECSLKPNLIRR